jgi:hypothetical protein
LPPTVEFRVVQVEAEGQQESLGICLEFSHIVYHISLGILTHLQVDLAGAAIAVEINSPAKEARNTLSKNIFTVEPLSFWKKPFLSRKLVKETA